MSEQDLYSQYNLYCRMDARVMSFSTKRFRLMMEELQNEFSFKVSVKRELGKQEEATYYGFVKVAKRVAA